ncbi:hypothetical protein LSH36_502g00031 [Paralvinella palmiformis]|uniref:Protein SYS1 homolog n=1 Tax=Paralvinella palmiformis TaxID=53620 RepID=A0AAD9J8M9_9ANNE|nr:hypothetical protein LSH36_502g00031 [Paralvinella palmiformis]
MAGQFRSSVWDPVLIIAQILTMQSVFYVSLGAWVCILDVLLGTNRSLEQLFGYEFMIHNLQATQLTDVQGRFLMVAYFCNALTGSAGLWFVVQRTKLCWDFSVTAHLVHLVICWIFNGWFPSMLSWWLITVISVIMMTVLGEFLCMRTEMKAIPLGVGPRTDL